MAQLEASHMLGDFLVRNRVFSEAQLSRALEHQRRVSQNLEILSRAEQLLGEDELALLHARLQVNEETIESAIRSLELLSEDELAEITGPNLDFRIPLGLILEKLKIVRRAKLKTWLGRFEKQNFDQSKLKKQLRKNPIFATLSPRALSRLCAGLTYKYQTAGEFVYRAGEKSNGIFIVESGLVRIVVDIKDESRITGSRQNGEMFGMPGVLAGTVREESALAITDTVMWRISNSDFMRLIRENPRIAEMTSRRMGGVYQSALHHLRHKTKINDSRLSAIFFAPDSDPENHFAHLLVESLITALPPNALILSTLPNFTPPAGRGMKRAASPAEAAPKSTRRKDVFFAPLQRIERSEIVDGATADWLRQAVERYSSIVILSTPGTREFRRFIMGLSRRSVTLVRSTLPDYLKFLKPGRDRIYQLSAGNTADLANRRILNKDCAHSTIPSIITPDLEPSTADRIARWIAGKSVGIAFGGGGARALSHVGVLEVIERTGIVIDMISGSSAGAHVGGMVAIGRSVPWMHKYFLKNAVQKRGNPFNDFTFPRLSFIRGKKYFNLLKQAFADRDLTSVEVPFFPLATDMQTGKPVVLRSGKMAEAVLASGSVPGIFPPIVREEGVLADGGMINNIPANILKDWDTSFVISINTSIDPGRSNFKATGVGRIMLQALDIFMMQSVKIHEEHTDFEIKPDVDEFSVTDHRNGLAIIEAGRQAARKALPQLLRALKRNGITEYRPHGYESKPDNVS